MTSSRLAFALLAGLLLVLQVAGAAHEDACEPEQHPTMLDTGAGSPVSVGATWAEPDEGRYYVARDPPPCPSLIELCTIGPDLVGFGTYWIYEESNGLIGLQRDDEVVVSESCGHGGDTIVF